MCHYLYRHFNDAGELLYVGVTMSVFKRTSEHEDREWFPTVRTITVEVFETRDAVLAAEVDAIKAEGPIYNIRSSTQRKPLPVRRPMPSLFDLSPSERKKKKAISDEDVAEIRASREAAAIVAHKFELLSVVVRHVRGIEIEKEIHEQEYQDRLAAYFESQEKAARKEWEIISNYLKSKAA